MTNLPNSLIEITNEFTKKYNKKLKVGAYARVSSDHEDQLNSYNNQLDYWKEFIENVEGWEFAGLYADEGISGTSTKKRTNFNRMINECKLGKANLILTKSISRFARNTVDCLQYTRLLKEYKVGVFFESDNIYTLDNDGELRLSLMATLAQEESRRISENVKWGHKRAMKKGIVYGNDKLLGYDRVNKKLVVNEDEAEIVRAIFKMYVEGNESLHGIVRRLAAEYGFTRGKGGGKLDHSAIKRILSQEKYIGNLIQSKYITKDFLTHKQEFNDKENYIALSSTHDAIIDKETFYKAQSKLQSNIKKRDELGVGYSKSVWNGKLICGYCERKFRKKTYKNKDGSPRPVFQCTENVNKGLKGCENGSYIREDVLEEIFMSIVVNSMNDETKMKLLDNFISTLNRSLSNVDDTKNLQSFKRQLNEVTQRKDKLLDSYLNNKIRLSEEQYNTKYDELEKQEQELQKQIYNIEGRQSGLIEKKQKLERLHESLNRYINLAAPEFNKQMVVDLLEKIVVFKDKLKIYLTLGEHEYDLTHLPKRKNNNGGNGSNNNLNGGVVVSTTPKRLLSDKDYFLIFNKEYTHEVVNSQDWNLKREKKYNIDVLLPA